MVNNSKLDSLHLSGIATFIFPILLVVLLSCSNESGKKDSAAKDKTEPNIQTLADMPYHAEAILPPAIETYDINRLEESMTIKAVDSKEHLGGSAGHYLDYNFIGLTSAKYIVKGIPISVEIAEFASSEDAYGHYSVLRPNGAGLIKMGTESYSIGASRYITQGPYVATMSTEDTTNDAAIAVSLLAHEIVTRINDKPSLPNWYILFPYKDKIAASTRYYAYNYLGMPNFNKVYTTDFLVNKDTVTIFLTHDTTGGQFIKIMDYANSTKKLDVPALIDFDKGYSVSFLHPKYGIIIAGMAREKVVGIINYNPEKHFAFIQTWVKDLQR
ncbi:MAG: DUF6599 family protein [bacterium]